MERELCHIGHLDIKLAYEWILIKSSHQAPYIIWCLGAAIKDPSSVSSIVFTGKTLIYRTPLRQGRSVHEVSRSLHISMGMASKIRKQDEKNIPIKKRGRPSKGSKATKTYLARLYSYGKLLTPHDGQQLMVKVR
jgi:hypothetical protein